jgi:hypothetical protein
VTKVEYGVDSEEAATLTITYSGEDVNDGEMAIDDFVPAIVGLKRLFERSATIIAGEQMLTTTSVKENFKKSSFEFTLALSNVVPAVVSFIQSDNGVKAREILSHLFSGAHSVVETVKKLKGEGSDQTIKTSQKDGSLQIIVKGNNNVITVNPTVAKLIQDEELRETLLPIVRPLRVKRIDHIKLRPSHDPEGSTVDKQEAKYFLPAAIKKPLNEDALTTTEEILEIIKPSFERDIRWKFRLGNLLLGADMLDDGFLRKVRRREIRFGKGDRLHVLMKTRKYPDHSDYFIVEVLRPILGLETLADDQMDLGFD